MFIYNVTIKLQWSIHEDWVKWMQEKHLADVMATGCFTKYQMVRLMDIDEEEGPTYAIQYYCDSKAQYNQYIEMYAPKLRLDGIQLFGDKMIGFRSLMKIVH
ncbi:MAG: DUF4286 family protein [Chitinophagaceae bacterium]|nr:DUF4286 family protein [Chitinophagaceae bacterium]